MEFPTTLVHALDSIHSIGSQFTVDSPTPIPSGIRVISVRNRLGVLLFSYAFIFARILSLHIIL